MSTKLINNIVLKSKHNGRTFISDLRYVPSMQAKPIIIFVHGLKGFKDWGHWNLIAETFAEAGFIFAKLNLSHNGTTPEHPMDFADLEAFGSNNFSIELDDVGVLIDFLFEDNKIIQASEMDLNNVFIIGHSRGGGLAILKAQEDSRIKGFVTWASVDDYGARWSEEELKEWKQTGIRFMYNGRTKQNMPQRYQIVENYWANQQRLNIKNAITKLDKSGLLIHGSSDETVSVESLRKLVALNADLQHHIIKGANHVFGGRHPYDLKELPKHTTELVETTIDWLQKQSS